MAFRYLAADQHPDHDTIASYRQQHLQTLAGLFTQVLQLCMGAGPVRAEVEGLLKQAQETDAAEDEKHGRGRRGDEILRPSL